ncbi:MAG TPA: 2-phospho-L-lactate transferase CofD family protein, partial [Candidatus Saccharimonadales bacterium]|nr:2-phospho-L-lactate transferase CofD family protein [Candidatus Saccharimonadales bacterium]
EKMVTQSFFASGDHPSLFLKPAARLNAEAARAIKAADLIIMGPGNIYSSLVPTLLVEGMGEALRQARGKKIYVCNLVTKPGQTDGFKVNDFVATLERYAGGELFDYVVYNSAKPAAALLEQYAKAGELWVEYDPEVLAGQHYQAIGEPLMSKKVFTQDPNDSLLPRTLIRHDNDKLARLFMRLYFS